MTGTAREPGGDAGSKAWILAELFSVLSRVVPAAYFSIATYAFLRNFLQTGKWTSLFWTVSEGLVVLFLVFRRESTAVSRRPWDWLVGIAGTVAPLLVRPGTLTIVPEAVGVSLQIAGTLFEIYGKAVLGRSFGIIAANRGIVLTGPYRLVRHPIYLGYLVTHVGFFLCNWSPRNMGVYLVTYVFMIARIFSEERLLRGEATYRDYCGKVRFRLIPRLF